MQPYNDTQPKKEQVRTMFNKIAPRYDRLNDIMSLGIHRRWRRKTVRLLAWRDYGSVLDLASGTGDMAIEIAKKLKPAHITAADLSPNMLEIAERKFREAGLDDTIRTVVAEAESLPFPDGDPNGGFDAATVVFGVRNFHDIPQGISEMNRVLAPGGVICVLEFSVPRNKIFGALFRFYFHRFVPAIGGLISGDRDAYRYLPESVDEFPAPHDFLRLMEDAGFHNCKARSLTGGVAYIYTGIK